MALFTIGIDIGTGAVKTVLMKTDDGESEWLGGQTDRIRRRDPQVLARQALEGLLAENGLAEDDLAYVATTGEGENVPYRTGHFYSMTTHARGAVYLHPGVSAVMDVGALHGRVIRIDERGKVLAYKMTSQCASGSGQFLENIARYLGVALEEVGELSLKADAPEKVSSICAVLSETDVINMVSRQIATPNILKGIHMSMADRLVKLLKSVKVTEGEVLLTGGLAGDVGLLETMREQLLKQKSEVEPLNHPDSIYAGALGAALWGAYRYRKLAQSEQLAAAV